jgi:hypothetical protein
MQNILVDFTKVAGGTTFAACLGSIFQYGGYAFTTDREGGDHIHDSVLVVSDVGYVRLFMIL